MARNMRDSPLNLANLPVGARAHITHVDWDSIDATSARRLRELGLDAGVDVEALHRGSLFARDPMAVRVGRMRIILRLVHAAAFHLEPAA